MALTITRNYASGTAYTKAQIDSAYDSLETWANTTKLDSSNIQASGIVGSNIASGAITATQIAANAVTTVAILAENITTATIADENVTIGKLEIAAQYALCPTGCVIGFTTPTAPNGFLNCDGSAVSRTTYAALWAVMGITHGAGDGSTTFNVPDYQGYFLRGYDGAALRDPDESSRTAMNVGGNTGNMVGTVQEDAFAAHTHTFGAEANTGGFSTGAPALSNNTGSGQTVTPNSAGTSTETRPKNAIVNYIVKT